MQPAGSKSIKVTLPNNTTISSTHIGLLPYNNLPEKARLVHLFPDLKKCLISLGQLCDAGMTVTLTSERIVVIDNKRNKQTLAGKRVSNDGMWYIDLDTATSTQHKANSAYEMNKKEDIIKYLSAAMWNPIPESWIKAIDSGFFVTWPGLTSKLVRKYLANNRNIETDQGHLRATRKNIRSTKTVLDKREIDPDIGKKSNEFYTKIIDLTGKIYSDQTGRFPVQSSRGNKYIMVVYDHDSNAILPKALKSRSVAEHLTAIQEVHQYLNSRGIHPKIHIIDNECSKLVKEYIKQEQKIELILVPPYLHRANAVEKAIDIFKYNFITGLAIVDPNFLLY